MNNDVLAKTIENVRNHRDIELVITERRRNHLVSKPNYHTTKFLTENVLEKTQIVMNKPVYLGLSSTILMYMVWLCKTKIWWKRLLCYMDTNSSIVYIKRDDIYENVEQDVETWFDTSNYELDRPFPKEENRKVIGLIKDELGGTIMTKFVGLRAKKGHKIK